jgi:hypothetical protein
MTRPDLPAEPSRLRAAVHRLPWREGGLLALAVGGGLWLGLRQSRGIDEGAAGDARAATRAFGPGAGVAALTVRTTDGRITPLARLGEPAVVMVVSQSCGVCKEALRDFGRMAAGRPLPRLWLVTLEGAALGTAMTDSAGVRGAILAGPVVPAAEALFTFQIQGTPTFLALDAEGRVRRVFPGYPGREVMAPWVELMTGARDAL